MNHSSQRLLSIDALRGFDMFFIMGLAALVKALCLLEPGGEESWLYQQMCHAKWDGFFQHDTIFPLFLFIAGISFPFSLAKSREKGLGRGRIYGNILRRALLLILFGWLYNRLCDLEFEKMRWLSVLGRIGVAWAIAAVLTLTVPRRGRIGIAVLLLVGYWLLIRFVPAPDYPEAGCYTMEGNIAGYLDRYLVPGRLYRGTFDPEGLLGILPAVVTALLGVFTGEWIRRPETDRFLGKPLTGTRKSLWMLLSATVLLGAGLLWSLDFPINKSLWSSSFVLVSGAWSLALFALFYFIIDVKGWRSWARFFEVIGLNSITIYLLQRCVSLKDTAQFFFGGTAAQCSPEWGQVVLCAGYLAVSWLILWFLYRKKIFLKV